MHGKGLYCYLLLSNNFLSVVYDSKCQMFIQIIETCQGKTLGNIHYKIELIDTNSEMDINIAQELVARGYARPTKELAEVQLV